MKKNKFIKLFPVLALLFMNLNAYAQKPIAITIDDPNTYETPVLTWQERNDAILETLSKHKIKAALFVCGMRVDSSDGEALLKKWDEQNHLICNHSFSHLYFNSKSMNCKRYISDFIKCDSLINKYKNFTKLYRYPYLKEGNTAEKRDSMRAELVKFGYLNGSVTIDASDWYIDGEIIKVLKEDSGADLTVYKDYYIKHILNRASYYDSLAYLIFKRQISHTLLIHHSLLNALFLDDLLNALTENGWKLIDAKEAFKDNIFKEKPLIEPCGESIVWQCADQNEKLSDSLRYPGEDGEYEQAPLEEMIREYKLNKNIK